jgi:crotonobetainyl-CoA:carnitine CoA-transferase CaiB-like acyl-CoA transferase
MYVRLMNAIGRPDLAHDPVLQDNTGRVAAQARIDEAIASWAAGVEMSTALEVLSRAAVAAGPIYDVAQMFEDPHYRARELFERVVVDEGAALDIPAMHPRLADTPGRTDTPGPTLGQHTDAVLRDRLGYSPEHIAGLRAAGIV